MTQSQLLNNELYNFNESCEQVAKDRGCIVVYPEPNQLQIDIDSEEDFSRFKSVVGIIEFIDDYEIKPSSSGHPHYHITVNCNRTFTDIERIAFQFMLGSDYVRESLNLIRVLDGVKQPSRLFEKVKS